MKASEAHDLARKQVRGPAIAHLLEHVHHVIKNAATAGKFSVQDPLSSIRTMVMPEESKAVYDALRKDGYTVVDHPEPDPGHPCSRPYTTVSW